MIFKDFIFLDDNSTLATSEQLDNINSTLLTFEVSTASGSPAVTLEGKTETAGDNWTPLAVISGKSLAVVPTITESGNYFVPITGITSARFVNDGAIGSVRVYGRVSNEV